jgi:hypothetical protein
MDSSFFGLDVPNELDCELLHEEVLTARDRYRGSCSIVDDTLNSLAHVFRVQQRHIKLLEASMFMDLTAQMRGGWQHVSDAGSRAQYCIHCESSRRGVWTVLRTYSDFELLCIAEDIGEMMPPKWWLQRSADPAVVEARLAQLPDVLAELVGRLLLQCPPSLRLLQFFGAVVLGAPAAEPAEEESEADEATPAAGGEEVATDSAGYVYSAASTAAGLASGFASMLPGWHQGAEGGAGQDGVQAAE